MKHKWDRKEDKQYVGVGKIKVWVCKVCGCEKTLAYYKFATPNFQRNGQLYDYYVECIDMELENSKTID